MFVRTYSRNAIDAKDEWDVVGNKATLKNGVADLGLSLATPSEVFTAQGDHVTGDFENKGASLNYTTFFQNALVLGTNYAAGIVPTNVFGWTNSNLSHLTDGTFGNSNGLASETNAVNSSFDLDLGAGNEQAIDAFDYEYYFDTGNRIPEIFEIEGSNDGTNFTAIDSINISHANAPGIYSFGFNNSTPYRYYRFKTINSSGPAFLMNEFRIYDSSYPSTNNTVTAVLPFTGTKSFAPDTLIITDENDAEILGAGKINIVSYEIDGNSTTINEDLEDFKTRDPSLFTSITQLKLEIQPVNAQAFKTVTLSTTNASFEFSKQGDFVSRVAGQVVAQLLNGSLHAKSINLSGTAAVNAAEESNGTAISASTQFNPATAGTNLEPDFPIRNTILTGPNEALGKTVLQGHPSINNGDISEQGQVGNGSPFTHRIDLGANTQLNLARYYTRGSNYNPAYSNPHTVDFYRSDDDVSYTLVASLTGLGDGANAQRIIDLDISSFNARYIRWDSFSSAGQIHTEMELYLTSPTTNFNTIDTNFPVLSAPVDIAPATFKAYDENGTLITGAGKVNVAFKDVSGGDTVFSTLEDQIAITKGNLVGTTEFQVQVQPIALIQISKITVETVSGEIIGSTSGQMTFKQGGVQFGTISNSGVDLPGVFSEWAEDPDNAGLSLFSFEQNSFVSYLGKFYRNKSGGIIAKGTASPVVNTTDWEEIVFANNLDLLVLDLTISSGNVNVVDAVGYDANRKSILVRLTGTITGDVTVTMPPVAQGQRTIAIKDADGNGTSAPEFKLEIIPTSPELITENGTGIGNNAFELPADEQAQSFYEHYDATPANRKWEAI